MRFGVVSVLCGTMVQYRTVQGGYLNGDKGREQIKFCVICVVAPGTEAVCCGVVRDVVDGRSAHGRESVKDTRQGR